MSLRNKALEVLRRIVDIGETAVKAPGKIIDKAIEKDKKVRDFRENKNIEKMVENFGSPEKYKETIKPFKAPKVMGKVKQKAY